MSARPAGGPERPGGPVEDAEVRWHEPGAPLGGDAVLIADDLSAFDAATVTGLHGALRAFAEQGGGVLGLGAGMGVLCQAGLLPGALHAAPAEVGRPPGHVRVEGRATPFTWAIPAGRIVAARREDLHYVAGPETVGELAAQGRIILRRCDAAGGVGAPAESLTVAGLCDRRANVVGLLAGLTPFPHGLNEPLGRQVLACLRLRARATPTRAAAVA